MRWSRLTRFGLALIFAALAAVGATGLAKGAVSGQNPCPAAPANTLPWVGDVVADPISIPAIEGVAGATGYPGTVVRRAGAVRGRMPVVVLQHGWGGNQCNLWWVALTLASRGYVTAVHSSPFSPNPILAYQSAIDATRSAIANLTTVDTSPGPLRGKLDLDNLGLGGHSLGSIVASNLQGDESLGISAILATDTLRRYAFGDPGGAVNECFSPPVESSQVVPRVPALSFAKDEPCDLRPDFAPPDLKLTGPRWWTAHGIPNMQLVMRGHQHNSFGHTGTVSQRQDLAGWIVSWFDRWLKGDRDADQRLLTRTLHGRPTDELLSTHYQSSACMPGRVDSEAYRDWLGGAAPGAVRTRCDRYDPPPPVVDGLRMSLNRKVTRPRGALTLTLRVRNRGYGAAAGLRVRMSSSRRTIRLPRVISMNVPPRSVSTRRIKVRIGSRARGRVILRATASGKSHRAIFRIRRAPRN